jgi:hypothetical protein
MTNRIGTSRYNSITGETYIELLCRDTRRSIIVDMPEHLYDIPEGWVIYIDRSGMVQAKEEP